MELVTEYKMDNVSVSMENWLRVMIVCISS